jgi:hypothetical protein
MKLSASRRSLFPSLPPKSVTEHPPLLLVETHLLELVDHVQKP